VAIGDAQRTTARQSLLDIFNSAATTSGDSLTTVLDREASIPPPTNRLAQGIATRRDKQLTVQETQVERQRQVQTRIDSNSDLRTDIERFDKEGRELQFIDQEIQTKRTEQQATQQAQQKLPDAKTTPEERIEAESTLSQLGRTFNNFGLQIRAGATRGTGGLLEKITDIAELVGRGIGLDEPRSKILDNITKTFVNEADRLEQAAQTGNISFINEVLGEALGGGAFGIAEFTAGISANALFEVAKAGSFCCACWVACCSVRLV